LPGDGIGAEVVDEGLKVLRRVGELFGHNFEFSHAHVGWAAVDATGTALPEETVCICRESDAIYFGAVGDPARDATPRCRPASGPSRWRCSACARGSMPTCARRS
jgi:3-isopropylmalate dehydrogenase